MAILRWQRIELKQQRVAMCNVQTMIRRRVTMSHALQTTRTLVMYHRYKYNMIVCWLQVWYAPSELQNFGCGGRNGTTETKRNQTETSLTHCHHTNTELNQSFRVHDVGLASICLRQKSNNATNIHPSIDYFCNKCIILSISLSLLLEYLTI